MKRITITGIVLLSGMLLIPTMHLMANENGSNNQGFDFYVNNVFSDVEDTKKVLELPKGGYLIGEATLITEDGSKIKYNSEEDPNSKTVSQAKIELIERAKTGQLLTEWRKRVIIRWRFYLKDY